MKSVADMGQTVCILKELTEKHLQHSFEKVLYIECDNK